MFNLNIFNSKKEKKYILQSNRRCRFLCSTSPINLYFFFQVFLIFFLAFWHTPILCRKSMKKIIYVIFVFGFWNTTLLCSKSMKKINLICFFVVFEFCHTSIQLWYVSNLRRKSTMLFLLRVFICLFFTYNYAIF